MSNNWTNFLCDAGASFNELNEVTFSQSITSLSGSLYLTDLSWLSLIEVKGDDKKTFLQGQLTNDITLINDSSAQLSGLCTPKGRLRALFSIFNHQDNLYLQLPQTLSAANLKRLKMFVMMSKVELTDVSDQLFRIGIYGTAAATKLGTYGFEIPDEYNEVTHYNEMTLIRLAGDTARFECIASFDNMQKLWQKLEPDTQLLDTNQWRLVDIQAGIPNVFTQTNESFIPQMLNLHVLNGVNFKKGCYTGQEVVARMQYLGKLKRRMYIAHCDTTEQSTTAIPGQVLYSANCKSGQGAGHIVDVQSAIDGGIDLTAVITSEAVESNDIFLDEALSLPLIIKELPYSLE